MFVLGVFEDHRTVFVTILGELLFGFTGADLKVLGKPLNIRL